MMTGRMMMFILVTILGAVLFLVSGWVFLVDGESRFLMQVGLGVLFMVGGVLNIRRERINQQNQVNK